MKKGVLYLFFSLLIVSGTGCKKQQKEKYFDYGKIENGVYSNDYFGFQITVPSNWVVQSDETMEELRKQGRELLAGDDERMKKRIAAADVNSANLITIFQYEMGAPVEFNPSMVIMAENLKNNTGIKSGKDYLFHVRKHLQTAGYGTVSKDFPVKKISGREFYLMVMEVSSYTENAITQEYYAMIQDGMSLNIILSYNSEEQETALRNILNTLKF